MKTILLICLLLLTTTILHAQDYHAERSEFDSGCAAAQSGAYAHAGVFNGWLRTAMKSANYQHAQYTPVAVSADGASALTITLTDTGVRVAWPSFATGFGLQQKASFEASSPWLDILGPYSQTKEEYFVEMTTSEAARFYRLRKTEP